MGFFANAAIFPTRWAAPASELVRPARWSAFAATGCKASLSWSWGPALTAVSVNECGVAERGRSLGDSSGTSGYVFSGLVSTWGSDTSLGLSLIHI